MTLLVGAGKWPIVLLGAWDWSMSPLISAAHGCKFVRIFKQLPISDYVLLLCIVCLVFSFYKWDSDTKRQ